MSYQSKVKTCQLPCTSVWLKMAQPESAPVGSDTVVLHFIDAGDEVAAVIEMRGDSEHGKSSCHLYGVRCQASTKKTSLAEPDSHAKSGAPSACRYWKRSALWNGGGLACKTILRLHFVDYSSSSAARMNFLRHNFIFARTMCKQTG